jgi:hypothetical protein
MRKELVRYGLAAGLLVGLGLSGAEAAATRPISAEALGLGSTSTPVAMCGFRCAYGGRYIPGPPGCLLRPRAQLLRTVRRLGWPATLGRTRVLRRRSARPWTL